MLGIGDMGASRTGGDVIRTLGLGSCVAIVFLDPAAKVVGMVHVALPDSAVSPERVKTRPGYFADSAMPAFIETMKRNGSTGNVRNYIIKLVGGARIMDPNNTFNVGNRNVLAIKKILWQHGAGPVAEDVGGQISRSVAVDVDTGTVKITSPARGDWVI